MKKQMLVKGFVALIILLSFLSCRPPNEQEGAKEESFGAASVKVFEVKKQRISEKLFYTGVIEAWKNINITPDVGGKIVERMERLKSEKAVSDQQYEKVKLAYEAAEAQLQQARAALNLAEHNLDVSLMKAPFSGVVASRNAEVGDVINPMMGGFSPSSGVLTLMDFYKVKIEIDASHRDIVRIKKGQAAQLRVSAFPDKVFQGRVAIVNLTADPLTKKFKVEVGIDNPDLILRPNTFGEITLEVSSHEDALVIPQKAVLESKYIFLAGENNQAQRREVTLGLQNADLVEILNGLKEGDFVIVDGNYGLEDGAKIDIQEVIQ